MRHIKLFKLIFVFLSISLCLSLGALFTGASGTASPTVTVTPSVSVIGQEAEITVSIAAADLQNLRGIQIDISGLDESVIRIHTYEALIDDPRAVSNTVTYSRENQRLRYVYAIFTGSLPVPENAGDSIPIFRFSFTVQDHGTSEGELRFPMTVKLQTAEKITVEETVVVQYKQAHEHTPGTAADCTHDQVCTVCGEVIQDKLGHAYRETVVPSTCTEQGYTNHACTRCGESYKDGYTAVAPHTPGGWIIDKEPAAGVAGEKHRPCTVCGTILETVVIAPLPPETELDTKPETEPDTEPETEPDTEPETEPETEPYTEPDAETDAEPDSEIGTDSDTVPESNPPTGEKSLLDRIAKAIGWSTDQLLIVGGSCLGAILLLVIVIAVIRKIRYM